MRDSKEILPGYLILVLNYDPGDLQENMRAVQVLISIDNFDNPVSSTKTTEDRLLAFSLADVDDDDDDG